MSLAGITAENGSKTLFNVEFLGRKVGLIGKRFNNWDDLRLGKLVF